MTRSGCARRFVLSLRVFTSSHPPPVFIIIIYSRDKVDTSALHLHPGTEGHFFITRHWRGKGRSGPHGAHLELIIRSIITPAATAFFSVSGEEWKVVLFFSFHPARSNAGQVMEAADVKVTTRQRSFVTSQPCSRFSHQKK